MSPETKWGHYGPTDESSKFLVICGLSIGLQAGG